MPEMTPEDKLAMYEAMAIAEERRVEIDKLKREKEELEQKLQGLQVETAGSSTDPCGEEFDAVWEAIENLQKQTSEDSKKFRQDIQKNSSRIGQMQQGLDKRINKLQQNIKEMGVKIEKSQRNALQSTKARKSQGPQREAVSTDTILVFTRSDKLLALSRDCKKWIEFDIEQPEPELVYDEDGYPYSTSYQEEDPGNDVAAICLNDEIYMITDNGKFKKLNENLQWDYLQRIDRIGVQNSCVAWNGYIWICGGHWQSEYDDEPRCYASMMRYDPTRMSWEYKRNMTTYRTEAAAAIWNDHLIVCGGRDDYNGSLLRSMEFYDSKSGVWTEMSDLPSPRCGHSLYSYGDQLIAVGNTENYQPPISINPSEKKWKMETAVDKEEIQWNCQRSRA